MQAVRLPLSARTTLLAVAPVNNVTVISNAFEAAQRAIKQVCINMKFEGPTSVSTKNLLILRTNNNEVDRLTRATDEDIKTLYSEVKSTKTLKDQQREKLKLSINRCNKKTAALLIERIVYLLQILMGSLSLKTFTDEFCNNVLIKNINIFLNYLESWRKAFPEDNEKDIEEFIALASSSELDNIGSIRNLIIKAKELREKLYIYSNSKLVKEVVESAGRLVEVNDTPFPPFITARLNIDLSSEKSVMYFNDLVKVIVNIKDYIKELSQDIQKKEQSDKLIFLVKSFYEICNGMLIQSSHFVDFDDESRSENPGASLFYSIYLHLNGDGRDIKDIPKSEMFNCVRNLIETWPSQDMNVHHNTVQLFTGLMNLRNENSYFKDLKFEKDSPYYLSMYGAVTVHDIINNIKDLCGFILKYEFYLENIISFVENWLSTVSDRYESILKKEISNEEQRSKPTVELPAVHVARLTEEEIEAMMMEEDTPGKSESGKRKKRKPRNRNKVGSAATKSDKSEEIEPELVASEVLESDRQVVAHTKAEQVVEPIIQKKEEQPAADLSQEEPLVEEKTIAPVPNAFEALPKSIGEGIDSYKKALHLWKDAFESFERNKDVSLVDQQRMFDFFRIFPKKPVRDRFSERHKEVLAQIKMVADYFIPLVESAYAPTLEVSIPIEVIDLRDAESKISFIVNQISVCVKKYVEQAVNYEELQGFFVSDAQYLLTALNAINRILEADCSGNLRKYAFEFSKNELLPYMPAIKSVARNAAGFVDKINDAESEFYRLGLSAPVATRNMAGPT